MKIPHTASPPATGDVVEQGKRVHEILGELVFALPGRRTVPQGEVRIAASRLRLYAKVLEQYAPACPIDTDDDPAAAASTEAAARTSSDLDQQR